jgi:hypothetical protein
MATTKGKGTKRIQKKSAKASTRAAAKGDRAHRARSEADAAEGSVAVSKRGKRTGGLAAKQPRAAMTARPAVDPRLPEPGMVLRKVDRQGNLRCECTVEADGIRYAGKLYRSLSAAATAAAADLEVKGAQNGYVFWGLSRPARAGEDPLTRLQKSWARYEACARSVVATAPAERKPELFAAIERHRSIEIAAA